ncbi:translesion DNA synthesis-associated protein ImuA [Roseateles saccharophilus]|uniref:Protein ImuA n=1 Tax=Roseateles saccharophilus TaxID=304 RepID=A0A4R3UC29_ROSSA|nr:translesion DNA synthesis-associated protein ImuA [Roseateles saccharophilus]MDG0835736.1 translesion DNA synthesis-associated protein ImuA [Roseateles saccharophilus]TCU84656.1 protein ImuA [Roseateles saccharophilus]
MQPVSPAPDTVSLSSSLSSPAQNAIAGVHEPLPQEVETALWRGNELGGPVAQVLTTGFPQLDDVLPGGGWPCGALTEVLVPQFSVSELRLLSKVMCWQTEKERTVALVGPPHAPHAPGLRHDRVDERHLVWIDVDSPRDRLWCTEQLVKAGTFGAVLSWLPLVRAEQIRRLQVLASRSKGPVFLCRPESAAREASAAPLRVVVRPHTDWQLSLQVLKRKGSPLEEPVVLPSVPGGIGKIMTERMRYPSRLRPVEPSHAVVRVAAAPLRDRSKVASTS